jgi:hypothetical protein
MLHAPRRYAIAMVGFLLLSGLVLTELTFRTLFRPSEAIFEEPPVEGGAGATYRLFHAL